jgi:LytS/YehU family sensor histidine kinase
VTTVVILTIGAQISSMLWEEFQIPITKNQADGKFWKHAIEFLCRGPHVICSLFIALSMLRSGFMKEEEKVMLMIENNSAELQLLKAQIHPHFLFNTLNNIYSFALRRSLHASRLVTKLSAILKYMIYECEAPLVSVEQEVKMLRDYIGLEKVRYTEKLQIEINVEGNFKNKLIAPLLLIPFVENAFKHGASKMLKEAWIILNVKILADSLDFKLSNSKPIESSDIIINKGIGLTNIQKRLSLLYPGRHALQFDFTDNTFMISLHLPISKETPVWTP